MRWASPASLSLLTAFAFGCAQETGFVQVREQPQAPLQIRRVAVAPFAASPRAGAGPLPADAAALVAGYVADALGGRGLDVVAASDVAQGGGEAPDPRAVARAAHERFGADAVATGRVYRFRERSGEAMGSIDPASVGFEVRILAAPDGRLLWAGVFDETQVALSENLLRAPQYPGRGSRWLSAEEFARWGAEQVVTQVPIAAAGP
jgi:hypothetical protein